LGRGSRIVTILCDTGFRYLSSLYNDEWRATKALLPLVEARAAARDNAPCD
jgi:cysteine synthase A